MKRWAVLCLLAGCVPSFEDAPWRVDEARVLGIVSEPPEARPGDVVQLRALVASPEGTLEAAPAWSVCTRPRTSAERTAVTQRCLEGEALETITASWSVLSDACARFGPNVPPTEDDGVPQRPSDPDASGGYFVPIQAEAAEAAAFGVVRIRCDLPGVTREIFEAYETRYVLNLNPSITRLSASGEPMGEDPRSVRPGEAVVLEVLLDPAESYVRYEEAAGVLLDEREWQRVQWFVTDGELERGQVILEGDVPAETTWHAPESPTEVHGWVVVTDARGGASWRAFAFDVE